MSSLNHNIASAAVSVAATASRLFHTGQPYGDGDYFESHIKPVAEETVASCLVRGAGRWDDDTVDAELTAYFHDTVEDGKVTAFTITSLLTPFIGEVRAFNVAEGATVLARDERGESYVDYIRRLNFARPGIRMAVLLTKRADLTVNLVGASNRLRERYVPALASITAFLK